MNQVKKAMVTMLSTENINKNGIQPFENKGKLFVPFTGAQARKMVYFNPKHLYFSIKDEEIKEGDFIIVQPFDDLRIKYLCKLIVKEENQIYCEGDIRFSKEFYIFSKVIASTDDNLNLPRPSREFINKYCEKEGNIEFVNIEYEVDYNKNCKLLEKFELKINIYDKCNQFKKNNIDCTKCNMAFYKLKIAKDNTITIFPIKNQYIREEVVTLISKVLYDTNNINYSKMNLKERAFFLNKWLDNNLNWI